MVLVQRDMGYSYGPFVKNGCISRIFPGHNGIYQIPHFSSLVVGRFHEQIIQIIAGGRYVGADSQDECDIRLPGGQIIEVKSGHHRPDGRKNWVFGPTQIESLAQCSDIGNYFLALFCYGMSCSLLPDPATQLFGKKVVCKYTNNFLIFMRYSDCLLLDQQGKINTVVSGKYTRRLLLFRHVLELAQQRRDSPTSTLFSNADIPEGSSMVPLIGRGARQQVRNVVLGIDVDPVSLIPELQIQRWHQKFGSSFGSPVLVTS